MTRLLRFFALVVAIVALSAPSASVGMGVAGPAWTLSHTSAQSKVFSCKSMGGKRVLPCHPDLGVMATTLPIKVSAIMENPTLGVSLPLIAVMPEAELPPPRRV